jgi:hypothetical protein
VLWQYTGEVTVNTTSNDQNMGFLANLAITALATATTDYIPLARQVNEQNLATIPAGGHHPMHGKDGQEQVVKSGARAAQGVDFKQ